MHRPGKGDCEAAGKPQPLSWPARLAVHQISLCRVRSGGADAGQGDYRIRNDRGSPRAHPYRGPPHAAGQRGALIYGLYDSRDPDRLPGCAKLLDDKLREPVGGSWGHFYTDFKHAPGAKKNIFGHSLRVRATARETARAGHLWLNWGNWNGVQVVPEDYLRAATVTNPDILTNEPEENWKYGHGFWVNDHGKQWPDLPRDSFAAAGAGANNTWVCPRLGLVVSHNPGPWDQFKDEERKVAAQNEILARILDAMGD